MSTLVQMIAEDRCYTELAGYADYAAKVHYRLIPGVWEAVTDARANQLVMEMTK
jgi:hypothetical protein